LAQQAGQCRRQAPPAAVGRQMQRQPGPARLKQLLEQHHS
jgi:hypothetical protein